MGNPEAVKIKTTWFNNVSWKLLYKYIKSFISGLFYINRESLCLIYSPLRLRTLGFLLPQDTAGCTVLVGRAETGQQNVISPLPSPDLNLSQHQGQLFASGGQSIESVLHTKWQSIGVSASTSVPPMNTQD